MIPDIIDICHYLFPQLYSFLIILSLEELQDIAIPKRSIEFNSTDHSITDNKHTDSQANSLTNENNMWI